MIAVTNKQILPRSPETVMQSERIGSLHPTRISFVRSLIRRMSKEKWIISRDVFDLSSEGYGTLTFKVITPYGIITLVCFSNKIPNKDRTDRVIADRWDASFVLVNGEVKEKDIDRLRENAPLQELGRFKKCDLVLSRANKSIRLFNHCIECLSRGAQPELSQLLNVGYLMRTTAVYGNGKFGLSDLENVRVGKIFMRPYEAELLTVYLIRLFSFDLIDHIAKSSNPDIAVPMGDEAKRALGVGNATGLGMAPFLLNHPKLLSNWVLARETALMRVRAVERADKNAINRFLRLLNRAYLFLKQWRTDDREQSIKIAKARCELKKLLAQFKIDTSLFTGLYPWNKLFLSAQENTSLECQEILISCIIEIYPDLVDSLEDDMGCDEIIMTEPAMTIYDLKALIEEKYKWALNIDYSDLRAQHYFWYRSEEKEEPRLGERFSEKGAELELPIGVARDVSDLYSTLRNYCDQHQGNQTTAEFLIANPKHRHAVTRVQTLKASPYGEIQENLLSADCHPIDLLRCKLSIFGASKYDPKSDRWTRVTFFQGAPTPEKLDDPVANDWAFPVFDVQ